MQWYVYCQYYIYISMLFFTYCAAKTKTGNISFLCFVVLFNAVKTGKPELKTDTILTLGHIEIFLSFNLPR